MNSDAVSISSAFIVKGKSGKGNAVVNEHIYTSSCVSYCVVLLDSLNIFLMSRARHPSAFFHVVDYFFPRCIVGYYI